MEGLVAKVLGKYFEVWLSKNGRIAAPQSRSPWRASSGAARASRALSRHKGPADRCSARVPGNQVFFKDFSRKDFKMDSWKGSTTYVACFRAPRPFRRPHRGAH